MSYKIIECSNCNGTGWIYEDGSPGTWIERSGEKQYFCLQCEGLGEIEDEADIDEEEWIW